MRSFTAYEGIATANGTPYKTFSFGVVDVSPLDAYITDGLNNLMMEEVAKQVLEHSDKDICWREFPTIRLDVGVGYKITARFCFEKRGL